MNNENINDIFDIVLNAVKTDQKCNVLIADLRNLKDSKNSKNLKDSKHIKTVSDIIENATKHNVCTANKNLNNSTNLKNTKNSKKSLKKRFNPNSCDALFLQKDEDIVATCPKHGEFDTTLDSYIDNKYNCPECNTIKSRELCHMFFLEKFHSFKDRAGMERRINFNQTNPQFLKPYSVDGYNSDIGIAYVYRGLEHFEYIPMIHKNGPNDLIKMQNDDREIEKLCEENNVLLCAINYQFGSYHTPFQLMQNIFKYLHAIVESYEKEAKVSAK